MLYLTLFILQLLLAGTFGDHQKYPGTKTRPILSDSEAKLYTKEKYLQGWHPAIIHTNKADYVVGRGGYKTIQEAVNAAIKAGGSKRKYIKIEKGTYRQEVLIPQTSVPLTLYGTPNSPGDVHIVLSQGANMKGPDWARQVNPNGAVYRNGDPAWSMFDGCAKRSTIGTVCSCVFCAFNDNLEVAHLTIENPSTDGQAVAAHAKGDKQNFYNVHFYGFQDTLLVAGNRVYMNKPTIKGDVDFIFGGASAVFDGAQIIARGDRRNSAVVFAPNTDNHQHYGFLVMNSKITADNSIKSGKACKLARAWDSSSNPNANGQVTIRDSEIADVVNPNAPYDTATSGRAFSGNISPNRNLNDLKYNRFYEYKNHGGGA